MTDKDINHEAIHTAQIRELLYVGFYIAYVAEWLVRMLMPGNAYRNISFEREAYIHENNLNYLTSRKKWAFTDYLTKQKMTQKQLPRGLRNCNPGNIRITADKWRGLRPNQTDPAFFQFTEMRWGYRALIRTLQNYRKRHRCISVADFISRWAPSSENNTGAYIRRVCQDLQVPSVFVLDIEDKGQMCAMAAAISYVENGVPAIMDDVYAGWELL